MSITVGELRQKLSIYEDDTPVMVQGPNDDVWPSAHWVGESDDGEIVFVVADSGARMANPSTRKP